MVGVRRKGLPKNWRQQVAETLATKGFSVSSQKIYDTARGRVKDEELAAAVQEAVKELRKEHGRKTRRLRVLTAGI